MAVPVMWIRQNMLGSPGPGCNLNERTLTEAERKVQRSLQKLSIPEWYLNNNSRPPKILTHDTSFELRPAPWKGQRQNKNIVCTTPTISNKNTTVNRNGLLETTFDSPDNSLISEETSLNESTNVEPPKPSNECSAPSPKNSPAEKKTPRQRFTNISRTYPRVSPSRKIQNINIVFANNAKNVSPSQTLTSADDAEESQIDMTKDSLETTSTIPEIIDEEIESSFADNDESSSQSFETKVSRMPNQRLTYIKPWKSPIDRAIPPKKLTTDDDDSKPKVASSSLTSKAPDEKVDVVVAETAAESSTFADVGVTEALKTTRQPPKVAPRTSKLMRPASDDDEICDACKADASRKIYAATAARSLVGFRPRTLYSIDEDVPVTPNTRTTRPIPNGVSPTVAFLESKRKSSQLRTIIKLKEAPRGGKSLVQEIIEELNDKCKNSDQPAYATRGSKKFVFKLMRALATDAPPKSQAERVRAACERAEKLAKVRREEEKDVRVARERVEELPEVHRDDEKNVSVARERADEAPEVHRDDEKNVSVARERADEVPEARRNDEEAESSEPSSEDEVKSAAVSTSISYKDTDSSSNSSDSEIRSPTSDDNCDYDWNMNVSNVKNVTLETVESETKPAEKDEEDEESVYWIPVTKVELPRTSSMLSMVSRFSTNGPGQLSPCVSPIRVNYNPKRIQSPSNGSGSNFKTSDYVKALRKVDETTILDSGYSDRSRGRSSVSSDGTWFGDEETTLTASETSSSNSFSNGSYPRRPPNQFILRPFVI